VEGRARAGSSEAMAVARVRIEEIENGSWFLRWLPK
jgi:hypothetical protein